MKALLSMMALTLPACVTAPPPQYKPEGTSEQPGTAGSVAITAETLRRTGWTELGDALRASSPIFR
jgi:starvation-inducible outer membrane lipoprotein